MAYRPATAEMIARWKYNSAINLLRVSYNAPPFKTKYEIYAWLEQRFYWSDVNACWLKKDGVK